MSWIITHCSVPGCNVAIRVMDCSCQQPIEKLQETKHGDTQAATRHNTRGRGGLDWLRINDQPKDVV